MDAFSEEPGCRGRQIRVRESKNDKSRYVVLSDYISRGLRQYIKGSKPKMFLFNGREKGSQLSHNAVQQSFRLAMEKADIIKDACVHTLHHSFATHLLEQGVDIVTIKEQLGHAYIRTTMMYLRIVKVERTLTLNPFNGLYRSKS